MAWHGAGAFQGQTGGDDRRCRERVTGGAAVEALRGGCKILFLCDTSANRYSASKKPVVVRQYLQDLHVCMHACVRVFNGSVDRVRAQGSLVIFGLHMHHFIEYDPPWV